MGKDVSHKRHAELIMELMKVLLTRDELSSKDIKIPEFTSRSIRNYLRGLAELGILRKDGKRYVVRRGKILDAFDTKDLERMMISLFDELLEREGDPEFLLRLFSRMFEIYEKKRMFGRLGRKKKKREKVFFVEIEEEEKEEGEEEGEKRKFEPILLPLASCEKPD